MNLSILNFISAFCLRQVSVSCPCCAKYFGYFFVLVALVLFLRKEVTKKFFLLLGTTRFSDDNSQVSYVLVGYP